MDTSKTSRGPVVHFIIYHLPTLVYALAIIVVSSIPDLKTPRVRFFAADKMAHFMEYAVFAFLTFRSFSNMSQRLNNNRALWLSILFLSLFAISDEIHQSFVPGRQLDLLDLVMDFLGAFLVIMLFWLRRRRNTQATS